MSNEDDPIDADKIRETYTVGLDVWGIRPPATKKTTLLRELLTGHVQLLLPEVTNLAARMRGHTRGTAVHVIVRAHHLLEEGPGPAPAANQSAPRGGRAGLFRVRTRPPDAIARGVHGCGHPGAAVSHTSRRLWQAGEDSAR
ncbi:DUF6415 family natural product biosynthesis protein [Streptomyces sp. NPDC002845]